MRFPSLTTHFRLAVALFSVAQISAAATLPSLPTPQILAYYQDAGDSSAALHARHGSFNELSADTYTVNSLGVVAGRTYTADLTFARANHIVTFAVVSNYTTDFIPSIAHSVITSKRHTASFLTSILGKLKLGHYQGLNLDFEGIPATDRAAYTAFVTTVAAKLHAAGYLLVVSVPAKTVDDPTDSWSGAYDFAALGKAVDLLQLMTYDENGPWGDPGPVAGLDWVTACVQFAVSVTTPGKISLGMPAYGYDWDLTHPASSGSVAWTDIPALISSTSTTPQWDAASSSPFFTYTASGHHHVVWYENTQSLSEKAALVNAYQLSGLSVWALGLEDASFWASFGPGL